MTGPHRRPARWAILILIAICLSLGLQTIESEPAREKWLRPLEIFAAMDIATGSRVADIGAGHGFLTVRLSKVVGSEGRVVAVDVDERALDTLRKRIQDEHLENVEVVTGETRDPHISVNAFDAVVILNSYHEMPEHESMLSHILESLRPGGRLVVVEPTGSTAGQPRDKQIAEHQIESKLVEQELREAGFTITRTDAIYATFPQGGKFSLVVGTKARPDEPTSHIQQRRKRDDIDHRTLRRRLRE